MQYIEKEFKSILNKYKFTDSWFWCKYGINPYNGCEFGCIYCDTRSIKYNMREDFSETVVVKKNAAEMLDKRISRARTLLPDVVGTGSAADPYQAAERKYRNTRNMLKVLLKHGYPVHVITKSKNMLEDLELINDIAEKSWATVSLTITTADKNTARFIEPNAPSPEDRFTVINQIKKEKPAIQSGVLLMPVLPGLTDSRENMEAVIRRSKESGADYILFGAGLTMRDRQALYFLDKLQESKPELIPLYEKVFGFNYNPGFYSGSYGPNEEYQQKVSEIFFELAEKWGMPFRISRYIPDDYRGDNYRIAERLLNRSYLLQIKGRYWKNDFWAGHNIQNLTESIRDVFSRGELDSIRNVRGKIKEFVIKWLEDNPLTESK